MADIPYDPSVEHDPEAWQRSRHPYPGLVLRDEPDGSQVWYFDGEPLRRPDVTLGLYAAAEVEVDRRAADMMGERFLGKPEKRSRATNVR